MKLSLLGVALLFPAVTGPVWGDDAPFQVRASMASDRLTATLGKRLQETVRQQGVAAAVKICSRDAQELTRNIGEEQGVIIRRTSLRVRNPANRPDPVERQILEQLEAMHRMKKLPQELSLPASYTTPSPRYFRPIIVQALCLHCHGQVDRLTPQVRKLIHERYPEDRATGYQLGDLRGVISVTLPRR